MAKQHSDVAQAWDRLPDESAKAYEAFTVYRDLGVARSLTKAAQELNKHRMTVAGWSSRFHWVDRAEAWDRQMEREWQAEQAEARRRMARQHARIGDDILAKVVKRLRSFDDDQVEKMTVPELAKLADLAIKTQRDAYAMVNPIAIEHSGEVTNPASPELALAIARDPNLRADAARFLASLENLDSVEPGGLSETDE